MAAAKKEKREVAKEEPKKTSVLVSILILICGTISASLLTTNTLDFGGQLSNLQRYFNNVSQGERVFTAKELAKHDGSDPKYPVYLAINGKVYDVSAGEKYYGKGGSYAFFSGKDASRSYVTGCFEPSQLTHDLRGLTKEEISGMDTWIDFYEKSQKYFYVGKVVHDPIPKDAPLPPPCEGGH